ncbi:cupin domain-containing protein [Paenibacillus sp. V4I3]|uniref:cupin domain-containing protein n=1 Tax=Paenibacillus sp. V4I3 TaxID=3042305 RepID=UPI0035944C39
MAAFWLEAPGWYCTRHHHHLFELLCCLEGEGKLELNRESVTLQEGDWVPIKSGVRQRQYLSFSRDCQLQALRIPTFNGSLIYAVQKHLGPIMNILQV